MMAKTAGISVSSAQRIWRAHGLQPHRVRQFKRSTDPQFAARLRDRNLGLDGVQETDELLVPVTLRKRQPRRPAAASSRRRSGSGEPRMRSPARRQSGRL
jgi:hypothetical protein